jgi:ribosomal protein S18 acetylase RimI-like enzyme
VKESGVIGFAYFYSFFKEEAEAMILAAPDGDWHGICSSLLAATISECERRGHVRLLIMNDRRFGEGAKLLVNAGCKFAFSEHRMENTGNPMPPVQNVALCKVSNDDRKLRDVELACFGKFHSKLGQSRYLAVSEGIPVGKVDVNLEDGIAELTGFCVVPDLRKRGFGKSILSGIVDLLIEQGQERIFLDVQTDNDIALELYLKANFRKIFTIDYYQMPLERKNTS